MSSLRPLFRFDPGWLFTVAGFVIMAASALLPAQHDVAILKEQLAKLDQEEKVNHKRIQAYEQFLVELKSKDASLLTRLAASQLNLMPQGEAPVLMATSMEHTVSDWIEATVPPEAFETNLVPDTLLTRLASGQRRLWLMGGGALIVFIGLTTGIPLTPSTRFVATAFEEQWLEQTTAATATLAPEKLDALTRTHEPPGSVSSLDPLGPLDSVDVLDHHIHPEHATLTQAVDEIVAEIPSEKWTWDEQGNVEPYILMAQAESGNSILGANTSLTGDDGKDFWPHAAD